MIEGNAWIFGQEIQKLVVQPLMFHHLPGGNGMFANYLMHLLAALPPFHAGHEDCFRCHERQFFTQMLFDLFRINNHITGYIYVKLEHGVGKKKSLSHIHATNGGIVEGALEPLVGGRGGEIGGQPHELTSQAGHPFGSHRIAFVRHG